MFLLSTDVLMKYMDFELRCMHSKLELAGATYLTGLT